MRHDSHVRTDLLNAGLSRDKAKLLAERTRAALKENGTWDPRAHSGRREGAYSDYISVTTPSGWIVGHPTGSATVKVRGCDEFRRYALYWLRQELLTDGSGDRLTAKLTAEEIVGAYQRGKISAAVRDGMLRSEGYELAKDSR
jgi:hypothetical protein